MFVLPVIYSESKCVCSFQIVLGAPQSPGSLAEVPLSLAASGICETGPGLGLAQISSAAYLLLGVSFLLSDDGYTDRTFQIRREVNGFPHRSA